MNLPLDLLNLRCSWVIPGNDVHQGAENMGTEHEEIIELREVGLVGETMGTGELIQV